MASHELQVAPQVAEIARLIDWIEARCVADGVADAIRARMTLAVEEAVMNVIGHGFVGLPPPHSILVRLDITAKRLVAEIIDDGHPFDPTAAPDPDLTLPLEQRRAGGLGIHLMRGMTDRMQYRRSGGNNVLRLEKALA